VVGIKPTYGRVSRYGLVAFAPSLEQIGVISKTVRDGALLLDVISGKDNRDAMSLGGAKTELPPEACSSLSGVRVGLPRELFGKEVGDGVRAAVMIAADTLAALGAEVFEVSVPSLSYSSEAYYVISSAEASSNLARFDGIRYGHRAEGTENIDELYKKSRTEGFGAEVKRRIMLGAFVLSAGCQEEYYARAQKVRRLISNELEKAFESCDILLSPSAVTTAYKLGEEKPSVTDVYADDLCSVVANLAGLPAVSLPCKSSTSLPVGVQLMGKPMSEPFLLRVADALESVRKI
jgi:aspartyl-tRNA(Asn)/glutamyl-tRNA(Gln) amidotransferase subunit A